MVGQVRLKLTLVKDRAMYGNLGGVSPLCGRRVRIIRDDDNGKTVDVTIKDACEGCPTYDSIDLSLAAFQALGDLQEGVINMHWYFL
jgi:expansin (peptidoglycan-binding protein)